MKKFDGVKDYWELRGNVYEYNGPMWEDDRQRIKEEFKEVLLKEANTISKRGIVIGTITTISVIAISGFIFYLLLKAMI